MIRRACKSCEDEAMMIRRSAKTAAQPTSELASYIASSSARGQPIDGGLRGSFERSLGVGLSGVRVVADAHAASAADALGARAFTYGSTIWFGRGEYQPETVAGQRLLAHEVAHAVQQRHARPQVQRELIVGDAHDPAEAAADHAADAMMRGEAAGPSSHSDAVVRRECTATRVASPGDSVRMVTCPPDKTQWQVTRKKGDQSKPENRVTTTATLDNGKRINLGITICRGHTKVAINVKSELSEAEARALANALSATPILTGVELRPELVVVVTKSGKWRFEAKGGPTFDLGTRTVAGGGGRLELRTDKFGPIGLGVEARARTATTPLTVSVTIDIPTEKPTTPVESFEECANIPDVFECRKIVPGKEGKPGIPGYKIHQSPTTKLYAFFDKNKSKVVHWGFEGDPTPWMDDNEQAKLRIAGLVLDGFRMASIRGFASPEGKADLAKPTEGPDPFEGNLKLSAARAKSVANELFGYPTAPGFEVTPKGELYGSDRKRELPEGRAVEDWAIEHYATEDELRPTDLPAFRKQPRAVQLQQAYDRLRRVDILWTRDPTRVVLVAEAGVAAEKEHPGNVENCPPAVEKAARDLKPLVP
jgi:hypothetical protein